MQQNDPLRQLYIEYYSYLVRLARSFVNQDLAEDLVQETFLIAQKRLNCVTDSINPAGWLVNTLKNVIGNTYQKRHFIYTQLIPESIVDKSSEYVHPVNDMYMSRCTHLLNTERLWFSMRQKALVPTPAHTPQIASVDRLNFFGVSPS